MNLVYYLIKEAFQLMNIEYNEKTIKKTIYEGLALNKFYEMIKAHGGSIKLFDDKKYNQPLFKGRIYSNQTGYITYMKTKKLGMILSDLCGRNNKNIELDFSAGIYFNKKVGDYINEKEMIMEYFCSNKENFEKAQLLLNKTFYVESSKQSLKKLIYK